MAPKGFAGAVGHEVAQIRADLSVFVVSTLPKFLTLSTEHLATFYAPLSRHLLRHPVSAELRGIEQVEEGRGQSANARVELDVQPAPEPEDSSLAMSRTKRRPVSLLTLPLEIRLEIYSYLLLLPSYTRDQDLPKKRARVHPAILGTCAQIYTEAAPVLYGDNTWQAHFSLLSELPRLRACYNPVTQPGPLAQMRRWWVKVRMDAECPFQKEAATAAFTGADEVVLEVWQATFWGGAGVEVLERFEDVRAVRKVRILGSTAGFEGYLRWLAESMTAPAGREVQKYVAADDSEGKRLRGWL